MTSSSSHQDTDRDFFTSRILRTVFTDATSRVAFEMQTLAFESAARQCNLHFRHCSFYYCPSSITFLNTIYEKCAYIVRVELSTNVTNSKSCVVCLMGDNEKKKRRRSSEKISDVECIPSAWETNDDVKLVVAYLYRLHVRYKSGAASAPGTVFGRTHWRETSSSLRSMFGFVIPPTVFSAKVS